MKTYKTILSVILCILTLSACGGAATVSTDTTTAASVTEATTTTTESTTTTTEAATTVTVSKTEETTTTNPTETEPTTTASITTADNSSDTRTTQQKLNDLIAANPDVEIGYAFINADTQEKLFLYNMNMEVDVSGFPEPYWISKAIDEETSINNYLGYLNDPVEDNNSIIYTLHEEEGVWDFPFDDVVRYYVLDGDVNARKILMLWHNDEGLNYPTGLTAKEYGIKFLVAKSVFNSSTVIEKLAQWKDNYERLVRWETADTEKIDLFTELFSNIDNFSYFYEGTGKQVIHSGGSSDDSGECWDTGLVSVDGSDYIFVIYVKAAKTREDIVRDISRIMYEAAEQS
jgi:hypothetical protein